MVLCGHVNIHIPDPNRLDGFKQTQRDIAKTEKEIRDCDEDVEQLKGTRLKLELQKKTEDEILSKLPGFHQSQVEHYLREEMPRAFTQLEVQVLNLKKKIQNLNSKLGEWYMMV